MKIQKNIFLAIVALAASVCVSQAQLSLQVRIPFTDTGGGTTAASDTSTGGSNVVMQLLDYTGFPNSFQGLQGSGVSGLRVALDFSSDAYFTTPGIGQQGAGLGLGPVAVATNSALNFGAVTSFTATVWFKAVNTMVNAGANSMLGPRIFILGTNGITDKIAANSIALFWQQWNCIQVNINTNQINLPLFTNTYSPAGFVPTNLWLFYAITYDGGNVATIYLGTDQNAATALFATSATNGVNLIANSPNPGTGGLSPQVVNLGAAGSPPSVLMLGNRASTLARSFDGWINDFRFYTGAATANAAEDIRWSAVAPANLVGTAGNNQSFLTWNALGGAASYKVLRSGTSGGPYTQLASGLISPGYTDATALNGNTYYYVVTAVDANGSSTTSPSSLEVTVSPSPSPGVPTGFSATPGDAQVMLNWTAPGGSPTAATYDVARSLTSGNETVITNVSTTTCTDTGLTNGIKYFYKVRALSSPGSASAFTTETNATPVGPPLAPTGLTSIQGNHFQVVLYWTDPNPTNIQTIDTFTVQRSPDQFNWTTIATGLTGTNYTDTTTTVNNAYYYQVFAVNANGTSPASSPTTITLNQQVTLQNITEATVRAGANANVVVNAAAQGNPGFQRVKYVQDAAPGNATSCAKSYFKWDFTGLSPNTNANLTLSLVGAPNSQLSAMRVWSLDQAYPEFVNGVLTWNNAHANDTNFVPALGVNQGTFQMLTNGPFTAHPVANFSAAGTTTVKIPAPWGNLIINNQMVLVICGTNNAALAGNNGYRMITNTTALVFPVLVGTNPPTITALPNVTVTVNQNSVTNSFTITDPDGNVATLTATAVSSDLTGTIISGVTILGSGANEMIYVTAGGTPGTATVEVTVTDELGDQAQRTFNVTVVPQIFPPTVSTPANTNTFLNTPVTVPFTIGSASVPVSTLTVNASVNPFSANELASTTLGGSGANRTVIVTPATNADGVGLVDLSVSDTNGNTVATSFAVMILTNYAVFADHFDYADGSIFPNSDGLWGRRGNVQFQGLNVGGGAVNLVSGVVNDNGDSTLVGAPYAPNQRAVIYITFTGNWSAAPTANSGGFVSLARDNTGSSPQVCHIGSTPDLSGDGGNLYLMIANGAGFTTNFFPIVLGTPYVIAARYDVDTATATLWINATNEADISATNVARAVDVTVPIAVSQVDLNQNGNTGNLILDDLKVSVVTRPAITAIRLAGGNVQIDFSAGATDDVSSFGVLATPNLNNPLAPASATISSLGGGAFRATLPASSNQGFYRLIRRPFNFY